MLLSLEYDPSFTGEEILLQMPAMGQKTVENAGRNFFDRFEKARIQAAQPEQESSSEEVETAKKGKKGKNPYMKKEKEEKKDKSRIAALKISDLLEGYNLYDLLEVSEEMPIPEIKVNYKKLVLKHHPDKQGAIGDEDERKRKETHFIRIQEAFEILTDEEWRKKYDSSLPFDDSIPTLEDGDCFFEKFGEAFHRFSRFSVKKPVPALGDDETPYAEVQVFYDFWETFQSWRDGFQMALEAEEDMENLSDAEDRMEKRWMERQNAKQGAKYKRIESERIEKLVQRAKTNDPRVIDEKARLREEREQLKAAKEYERNRVRLEKEAEEQKKREAEEAENAIKEAERLAQKEIRQKQKQIIKESRRKLRVAVQDKCSRFVDAEQLQDVILRLEKTDLESHAEKVLAASAESKNDELSEAAQVVHDIIRSVGLTPIIPAIVEETESTMDSAEEQQHEAAPMEVEEDPEERRLRLEQEAVEAAKAAKAAAAKEAKMRAANAARKNQQLQRQKAEEKKAEEARKIEEEKRAKEKAAQDKAKKVKDEQKKKDEGKPKVDADKLSEWELLEDSRIAQAFSVHREKLLESAEALTDAEMRSTTIELAKSDIDFRGALRKLRKAKDDVEIRSDRLCWVLSSKGHAVFEIGTTNPATMTVATNVRNKSKKLRPKFRTFSAWALEQATDDELHLSDGKMSAETKSEGICSGEIDMIQEMFPRNAFEEANASANKKKKKAKKDAPVEENLDDIFAEFGIDPAATKKKKNKNKK